MLGVSALYFGEPWPSGICDDGTRIPTPVGKECLLCETLIDGRDRGTFMGGPEGPAPVHRECSFRSVMGGIGHWQDHYYWCIQHGDPDGGETYRESALKVWAVRNLIGR